MKYLKATGIAATVLLGIGLILAAELPGEQGAEVVEVRDYERLDADLEPLRSAFNRASDHVRAVLLVGPT